MGLSRLAARLLRFEVRALGILPAGSLVAADRQWMYRGNPGDGLLRPCRIPDAGQPVKTPLTITVGPGDRVLWGEYNAKTGHGTPVRIYASQDGGDHFDIVHVFPAGSILHVHRLLYDRARDWYWVFTGDFDDEPGIGILSADLKRFDWFLKGEQRFRLCQAFDFGDRLVYATDTPLAPNAILSLDKDSGRIDEIRPVEGSCLYACRFGSLYAFSTTVEPGAVDTTNRSTLWISRDGDHWERVFAREKDRWPAILQFGSLVLPQGESDRERMFFSGQALRGLDGRLVIGTLGAATQAGGPAA